MFDLSMGTLFLYAVLLSGTSATGPSWMLRASVGQNVIEGTPLAWSESTVYLLGRDGRLWQFAPRQASDFKKTSSRFQSYTVAQLRGVLLAELGPAYEVTGTEHYLVAHPRGQRSAWPERFENLYRSMVAYFAVRGFRIERPAFPLVGVVLADRAAMARYLAAEGVPMGRGLLGYYDVETNRIVLYDAAAGASENSKGDATEGTVIHEAAHQTAFNTGIHSRYAQPPYWLAEGLATLFEADGVHGSSAYAERTARINERWLAEYRFQKLGQKSGLAAAIITGDDLFTKAPASAYAFSWAFTFFLSETRPQQYAAYLQRTAARPPFVAIRPADRAADFAAIFGSDTSLLEASLHRFIDALP